MRRGRRTPSHFSRYNGQHQLQRAEKPVVARNQIALRQAALFSSIGSWAHGRCRGDGDRRLLDRARTCCAVGLWEEFGTEWGGKGEGHFESSKESYVAMQYKPLWNERPISSFDKRYKF